MIVLSNELHIAAPRAQIPEFPDGCYTKTVAGM